LMIFIRSGTIAPFVMILGVVRCGCDEFFIVWSRTRVQYIQKRFDLLISLIHHERGIFRHGDIGDPDHSRGMFLKIIRRDIVSDYIGFFV
jgi:hypothetical protein